MSSLERRAWSDVEDSCIAYLAFAGYSPAYIAAALHRPVEGVQARMEYLKGYSRRSKATGGAECLTTK
jgi:hypothetical protein